MEWKTITCYKTAEEGRAINDLISQNNFATHHKNYSDMLPCQFKSDLPTDLKKRLSRTASAVKDEVGLG
jgi:hypothetical protein